MNRKLIIAAAAAAVAWPLFALAQLGLTVADAPLWVFEGADRTVYVFAAAAL